MRVLKFTAGLLACAAVASALSYVAFHGFWIGARVFHSVPAARACDAIGRIILLPARGVFWMMGSSVDQTTPLFDPVMYAAINGTLLATVGYLAARRIFGKRTAG